MMKVKSDIHVPHPEVWELLVSISDGQLDYALYTPTADNSLALGTVTLHDMSLQALEEAVFDTPALLNEYRRVRIVVRSRHFLLLPEDAGDVDCVMSVRQVFPEDDGDARVCPVASNGVKIAFLMPRGLQAFLGRTFNYPLLYHPMASLCKYFKGLDKGGNRSRMFLHVNGTNLDLAIYRGGRLLCANSYPFRHVKDAAFFALSAWKANGLDQLADELQVAGAGEQCAELVPLLRGYVKNVVPAAFPLAAMRLGRNAMQAPLELILLALCE